MSDLTLRIDGFNVSGWTSIQVVRSLDAIADTFDLALTTRLSSTPPPVEIEEGGACEVFYGEELVLSGYIDRVDLSYNATSTTLGVSGRSKAGDLVDCSAVRPGKLTAGSWKQTPVLRIAEDLCDPFGIAVKSDVGELPKERFFKLQEGETVFAALARLAKDYGLRVVSSSDGTIRFTRTGVLTYSDVAIQNGVNVIAGGLTRDASERFSDYLFKGQLSPTDEVPQTSCNTAHTAHDDGVTRYRPILIESDEQVRDHLGQFTGGKAKKPLQLRAEWERNTRAGKSKQLSYEVCDPDDLSLSWEMGRYGLWEPNVIVSVKDDFLGIDGQYLVTSVTLVRDDNGTRTSLALTAPEAYEVQYPPKKKAKKGTAW